VSSMRILTKNVVVGGGTRTSAGAMHTARTCTIFW
jgi:hypothetical protein